MANNTPISFTEIDPYGCAAALARSCRDAVIMIDKNGAMLAFNAQAEKIFGYRADDILGQNVRRLMPAPEAALHDKHLSEHVRGGPGKVVGKGRVVTALRADGSVFPAKLTVERLQTGPGPESLCFCGVIQDLSRERATESHAATRQEHLAAVLLAVGEAVFSLDKTGCIELANPAAEVMLQMDSLEMKGQFLSRYINYSLCDTKSEKGEIEYYTNLRKKNLIKHPFNENSKDGFEDPLLKLFLSLLAHTANEAATFPVTATRKDGNDFAALLTVCARIMDGQRHFVVVLRDESERQSYETQLAHALQASESANRAKSRFLGHMSHELRTPLNAIIGFSDVMRQERLGQMSQPLYKDYAQNIYSCGRHLLSVVEDVLDITRLEHNEIDLDLTAINLHDLCQDLLNDFQQKIEEKSLRLTLDIPKHTKLWADRHFLYRVFAHILDNAIKFNPPDTEIHLTALLQEDGSYSVTLEDFGRGIPKSILETALLPFHDVDSRTTIAGRGAGLGLPLSARFMALQGGDLKIESEIGRGTKVELSIPPHMIVA